MNKDVAKALWLFARQNWNRELTIWRTMPSRISDKKYEAQRMKVACWYEAATQLYSLYEQAQKPKQEGTFIGISEQH